MISLAICNPMLAQMARWAAPAGDPIPLGGRAAPGAPAETVNRVGALLLVISYATLTDGHPRIPKALCTPAARAGWTRLADNPNLKSVRALGQMLQLFAAPDFDIASVPPEARVPPWTPKVFPVVAGLARQRRPVCWECGSLYRQPALLNEEPLRKCSSCQVASYCGAPCATAAWEAGHQEKCAAWRAYGEAQRDMRDQMIDPDLPSWGEAVPTRPRAAVAASASEDLSGDWRVDWAWPPRTAAAVLAKGLSLTDVVAVVEVGHVGGAGGGLCADEEVLSRGPRCISMPSKQPRRPQRDWDENRCRVPKNRTKTGHTSIGAGMSHIRALLGQM